MESSRLREPSCLNNYLDLFPPGFPFFQTVHPVAEVFILEFQLVSHHLPCQPVRRYSRAPRIRLGECGRPEQNDGHYEDCRALYEPQSQWWHQCAAGFEPAMHAAISFVRRILRTVRRSGSLSQPFRSSQFDYRTTCAQKADQNRAVPRQIRKDCLLTLSVLHKCLWNALMSIPEMELRSERLQIGKSVRAMTDPLPS